jgi:hypothetical protein
VPSFACISYIALTLLFPSCLLSTETHRKSKSKTSSSSQPTTFLPVPPVTAAHDEVELLDQDFASDEDEDQGGFAQGHSQSSRVAGKEPRVQVQQARKESAKEKAARLRREEREAVFEKQRHLALNQENLARKRKQRSATQDHLEESPRSNPSTLSAFRANKDKARCGFQPTDSNEESSSSDSDASQDESTAAKENNNPNIMGPPGVCNKTACKNNVNKVSNLQKQYDDEFSKNAKLTETNIQLEKKVAEMEKKMGTVYEQLKQAMKNAGTLEFSKVILDQLVTAAKNVLFYKYQFSLTEADDKRLAQKLYCIMYDEDTRNAFGSTHMSQWIKTYHKEVGKALSDERHFRNQQLKQVCWNWVTGGKDLPSVDLFHKVLMAQADLEDPEELDAVVFVWDKAAGALAGQSNWGPNIKANNLMCTAKSQHDNVVSFVHLALIPLNFGRVFGLTPPRSPPSSLLDPTFWPCISGIYVLGVS